MIKCIFWEINLQIYYNGKYAFQQEFFHEKAFLFFASVQPVYCIMKETLAAHSGKALSFLFSERLQGTKNAFLARDKSVFGGRQAEKNML